MHASLPLNAPPAVRPNGPTRSLLPRLLIALFAALVFGIGVWVVGVTQPAVQGVQVQLVQTQPLAQSRADQGNALERTWPALVRSALTDVAARGQLSTLRTAPRPGVMGALQRLVIGNAGFTNVQEAADAIPLLKGQAPGLYNFTIFATDISLAEQVAEGLRSRVTATLGDVALASTPSGPVTGIVGTAASQTGLGAEALDRLATQLRALDVELGARLPSAERAPERPIRTAKPETGGAPGSLANSDAIAEAARRLEAIRKAQQLNAPGDLPFEFGTPALRRLVTEATILDRLIATSGERLLPAHPEMQRQRAERRELARSIELELSRLEMRAKRALQTAQLSAQRLPEGSSRSAASRGATAPSGTIIDLSWAQARLLSMAESAERDAAAVRAQAVELQSAQTRVAAQAAVSSKQVGAGQTPSMPAVFTTAPTLAPAVVSPARDASLIAALALMVLVALVVLVPRSRSAQGARDAERAARPTVTSIDHAGGSTHESVGAGVAQAFERPAGPILTVKDPSPGHVATAPDTFASDQDLLTHLVRAAGGTPGFRTVVTGSHHATEVSPPAAQIAAGFAAHVGATLLVHWQASPAAETPSLVNVLQGTATVDAALQTASDGVTHVWVGSPDEASAVGSDTWEMLFDAFDEGYAHVVVAVPAGIHLWSVLDGRYDAAVTVFTPGQP